MNKVFIFFFILIFFNNCSFNSKSKFWTKEKNIKQEIKKPPKLKKTNLFTSGETTQKELNPNLKIKLNKIKLSYDNPNRNNNNFNK